MGPAFLRWTAGEKMKVVPRLGLEPTFEGISLFCIVGFRCVYLAANVR